MKIVNVKKFIRTISILVILTLIIILFSNKTYSKVDTKYKEESIILGDTLWSISQEESKNNKYFEGWAICNQFDFNKEMIVRNPVLQL